MALVDGMPRPLKAGSIGYRKSLQGDHPNEDHYHACFEERVKREKTALDSYFFDGLHFNAKGHQVLAACLVEKERLLWGADWK